MGALGCYVIDGRSSVIVGVFDLAEIALGIAMTSEAVDGQP